MAHILDKNFDSFLDFLHVLPGAWSAYRYTVLTGDDKYREDILEKDYFKLQINPSKSVVDHK
jgi:chitin synthase